MKKMKILVTGDTGYIGSVLTNKLLHYNFDVLGIDIDYFENAYLGKKPIIDYKHINLDIRDIEKKHLIGVDAIIHLAAISNDPLGELNPKITEEINLNSTVRLAEIAKQIGVSRFIFASSQSMYGISNSDIEIKEDDQNKNPITAYAISKWEAEKKIMKLASDNFTVSALRASTVFGPSPRFRSDIVFNNLMSSAFTSKSIIIKSDGSPWRPVIHVDDVCDAYLNSITIDKNKINRQAYNIGIKNGNYQIKDMANVANMIIKDCRIKYSNEHGNDSRTYKVSFDKIHKSFSENYQTKWDLEKGGKQIYEFFKNVDYKYEDFIGNKTNRLKQLSYMINNNLIDDNLRIL